MAREWIKMRVWLSRDPQVILMADYLSKQPEFINWLTNPRQKGSGESPDSNVTDNVTDNVTKALRVTLANVTVSVTVATLLVFWGLANDRGEADGDDLILRYSKLSTLDGIAGVPCFGDALSEADWAKEEDGPQVRLPNFLKNNVPAGDRLQRANAQRQSQWRARQRAQKRSAAGSAPKPAPQKRNVISNVTDNVTNNVTVTPREEKRREGVQEEERASEIGTAGGFYEQLEDSPVDRCIKHFNVVSGGQQPFTTSQKAQHEVKAIKDECEVLITAHSEQWVKDALETVCKRHIDNHDKLRSLKAALWAIDKEEPEDGEGWAKPPKRSGPEVYTAEG